MRRLVILRPEPDATGTVERARTRGLDAIAMPLFRIEPVAWEAPESGRFNALLLTSANAVRHGGDGLQALRGLPVHAVGAATAEAARDAGFDIASSGDSGVERLLGSIEPELNLLHLCGEQRKAPADARQEITPVTVYRATELPAPGDFAQIEGALVAVHSPRAAERFAELIEQAGIERATIRIAAISAASADAAGGGWKLIEVAEKPLDDALLALAERLCDKPAAQ